MQIHVDRRAQVAIRSLEPDQRVALERVLDQIATQDESRWKGSDDTRPLEIMNGEQLYAVRAGDLRLVSKVVAGELIVQDVFDRERLEEIAGKRL